MAGHYKVLAFRGYNYLVIKVKHAVGYAGMSVSTCHAHVRVVTHLERGVLVLLMRCKVWIHCLWNMVILKIIIN